MTLYKGTNKEDLENGLGWDKTKTIKRKLKCQKKENI